MLFTTLYRVAKTSAKSFWRNWWLSLATTLVMVLALVTIAFFISLLVITGKTTESLREKADLTVYFQDSASDDQIAALQSVLALRSDVKTITYVSKDQALAIWRSRKSNEEVKDYINETDNPLPRSIEIKAQNPEDLANINGYLNADDYKPLIKQISYEKSKQLIDRLVGISKFIKQIGYTLSTVFILIAFLIIYNTVRLTIFARSEEIEIMKLVGASDWYVRGPFMMEGIGYGIVGAIGASLLFAFFFKLMIPSAESYLNISDLNSSYLGINVAWIIVLQFATGIVLGGVCSGLAVKKHLK